MEYTIFNIGDEIWKTKDGKEIKYRDLELNHIMNIAKMKFKCKRWYLSSIVNDVEDMDYDEHEESFDDLMQIELERRVVCKTLGIEL